MQTVRITKTTFDSVLTAPDGSHRFPAGLVVGVGEGANRVDDETARRWVRAGFAEEFTGVAGTTVTNADAAMTPDQLDAQIATLRALRDQAAAQEGNPTRITREGFPGEAHLPSDEPIGRTPYLDPDHHPLERYGLSGTVRVALERAGFTRPAIIDGATDGELLAVDGVSVKTLAKLRGSG